MSLLRKIIISSFVIALAACGFEPVHQNYGGRIIGAERNMAEIKLGDIGGQKDRAEQLLKTNLDRELNISNSSVQKKYILDVTLTRSTEALGVKKDKEITRYKTTYHAYYVLRDISTSSKVTDGNSRVSGGYDAVNSDFATYAAEKDVDGRIMNELAKDIKLKLTSYFLANKKVMNEDRLW